MFCVGKTLKKKSHAHQGCIYLITVKYYYNLQSLQQSLVSRDCSFNIIKNTENNCAA